MSNTILCPNCESLMNNGEDEGCPECQHYNSPDCDCRACDESCDDEQEYSLWDDGPPLC